MWRSEQNGPIYDDHKYETILWKWIGRGVEIANQRITLNRFPVSKSKVCKHHEYLNNVKSVFFPFHSLFMLLTQSFSYAQLLSSHVHTIESIWADSNKVWTFWMWQSLLHQLCCKQTQCFERHVKCYATTKMVMPKRWTRESVFGVSHNLRKITHSLTQYRI